MSGRPGAQAFLLVARAPDLTLFPSVDEPLLLDPRRIVPIGTLNGAGNALHQLVLPPGFPPGSRIFLQALVVDGTGRRLSNSRMVRTF